MKKNKFIKHIKETSLKDYRSVGGKGGTLGEMMQAGFCVPPGFIITTEALKFFLIKNNIYKKIKDLFQNHNLKQSEIKRDLIILQNLIESSPLPSEVTNEIFNILKETDLKKVAVRSSATTEDSPNFSWAGVFDSFLNVSEKDIITFIKKCWSSLVNYRSVFYYKTINNKTTLPLLAVIIQETIKINITGVVFTVHPVFYNENIMIIEYFSKNLSTIQNQFTPATYIIKKDCLKVEEISRLQDKKISKRQIIQLVKTCQDIEKYFQTPCDIEWVYSGGQFYILQSRPITTIPQNKHSLFSRFARK